MRPRRRKDEKRETCVNVIENVIANGLIGQDFIISRIRLPDQNMDTSKLLKYRQISECLNNVCT
jgi:hypothetical protein